eukprot:5044670-Alexandrium_andersonii.AAC.1
MNDATLAARSFSPPRQHPAYYSTCQTDPTSRASPRPSLDLAARDRIDRARAIGPDQALADVLRRPPA